MACIEQKLGSGMRELKKWYFTFFVKFTITTKSIDKNKANSRKILVQVRNIGLSIITTHSRSFQYLLGLFPAKHVTYLFYKNR